MPLHPNLLDYATVELAQDAFLAWLLAWVERSDEVIMMTASRFWSLGNRCRARQPGRTGRAPV